MCDRQTTLRISWLALLLARSSPVQGFSVSSFCDPLLPLPPTQSLVGATKCTRRLIIHRQRLVKSGDPLLGTTTPSASFRLCAHRSICVFDETDFSGAAGDLTAFQDSNSFNRLDSSDDAKFYKEPRFVQHIDDAAIRALTTYYESEFQETFDQGNKQSLDILDLCSSWTSHFPSSSEKSDQFAYGRVVGLGMNQEELSANPLLTETLVHDLNQEPRLTTQFADESFDIITMAVSVDYLIQPLVVFQEIHRILRPGGKALISFSNRCFPTKAIATWLQGDDLDRLTLVASYFYYSSSGWSLLEALDLKDATQELPKRPTAQEIFANPAVGLAWMNSAAAVQKNNAGDPMFIVKGVKKAINS